MEDEADLYTIGPDEPSPFCGDPKGVNGTWIEYIKKQYVAQRKMRGQNTDFDVDNANATEMIKRCAGLLKLRIYRDLLQDVHEMFLVPPKSMYTKDGYVSLAWIVYVCRMDKMSPDEAYLYARALGAQK
jgi:hypothetical protein